MNLYGFAGGDPVNFGDPFGLCPDPKNPACSAKGTITTIGVSGFLATPNGGRNAQWAGAINWNTGDATFFETSGNSTGFGLAAGPGGATVTGTSFDDLVSRTGEGGGRSATGVFGDLSLTLNFDDSGHFIGGGGGAGGPAGTAEDDIQHAKGFGTVNFYKPFLAAAAAVRAGYATAQAAASEAGQRMQCPYGCKLP